MLSFVAIVVNLRYNQKLILRKSGFKTELLVHAPLFTDIIMTAVTIANGDNMH